MHKRIILSICTFAMFLSVSAEKYIGAGKTDEIKQITANCIPPSSARELNINNVTALIQSGGDMWWDLQQSPKYEVPKGSGKTSLFAGALWLGGVDVSNQLKVAGQRFRTNGNIDYWTGPLRNDGTAEIDPSTCIKYDKHFVSTRQEVATFVDWFQSGEFDIINGTSTQQEKYPSGYTIPKFILDWPWQEYDEYLAPFFDFNGDGIYNPLDGDYPGYDLSGTVDCRTDKLINIYGDQNLWWVFNDKGNIHTESGSEAIGMEIRAQAFAFATNDEVNDMTFYNYELVNRSTFTLTETYMGQWVDADLGNAFDDYVGCDVARGLGYCYNGDEVDEDNAGALGYGNNPPAIGVDFFQGPYQDNDGLDNEIGIGTDEALNGVGYGDGIPDNERFGMRRFLYHNNDGTVTGDPTNGSEYYNYLRGIWRDGSKMVYGGNGHPSGCPGNGSGNAGFSCIPADFMFPDDTDPLAWGTGGQVSGPWNEVNSGNSPNDRRFLQSAGPFTLAPGSSNNITVGVVWAQASSGGALGSVQKLRQADDKTQALFDNCFKLLEGPDAPELTFQELDQELVLYLGNCATSNNADEDFAQSDPALAIPDSVLLSSTNTIVPDTVDVDTIILFDVNGDTVLQFDYTINQNIVVDDVYHLLDDTEKEAYNTYKFQGYEVYQVFDNTVSVTELGNPDKSRLIAQCDIVDGVGRIINYEFDEDLQANVPVVMIEGADDGLFHSLKVTVDQFAAGDRVLVNHKTYYFMAIAYAYNNSEFNLFDPNNAVAGGQNRSYLPSRKACTGGQIRSFSAIPHKTTMESGGLIARANYGDELALTRMAGRGNGGRILKMSQASIDNIMDGVPDESGSGDWRALHPTYEADGGPISVKVIDPLNIPAGFFEFHLQELDSLKNVEYSDANWTLYFYGDTSTMEFTSDRSVDVENEQLILEVGLSVTIKQLDETREFVGYNLSNTGINCTEEKPLYVNDFLDAWMTFEDSNEPWLTGVEDGEGSGVTNWIRSGTTIDPNNTRFDDIVVSCFDGNNTIDRFVDPDGIYEGVLGGTWAPFRLTSADLDGPAAGGVTTSPMTDDIANYSFMTGINSLRYLQSVDVVLTSDKSKWTRCPVLEMQGDYALSEGNVQKGALRWSPSVDKNGVPIDTNGLGIKDSLQNIAISSDPEAPNYIGGYGMGWFPGYAINVETGERLNMAFGEDSWMQGQNGRDMIWNPTDQIVEGPFDNPRLGGKHYIFIFRNNVVEDYPSTMDSEFDPIPAGDFASGGTHVSFEDRRMPSYDYGKFMYGKLKSIGITQGNSSSIIERVKEWQINLSDVYRSAMWVSLPLLAEGYSLNSIADGLIPTETKIGLRVATPYRGYGAGGDIYDVGDALSTDQWYYVDKGPITYGNHTYQRGEYFWADNASVFSDGSNGDAKIKDLKGNVESAINGGRPTYFFNTHDISTVRNDFNTSVDALDLIGVVPNPYYSYSQYEEGKLDNRVKIINLPKAAEINIYTTSGVLVRTITKDDPTITSVDWDLKNGANITISSGLYLIHVKVPDVGERILKWYGMMRPLDLDNF